MYYRKIFFCLICLLSFNLFAQELGDLTIYNTNNSNLSYNKINCLEFDDENRLWIGTEDGLSVLDEVEGKAIIWNF